jgi:hypothetical protein
MNHSAESLQNHSAESLQNHSAESLGLRPTFPAGAGAIVVDPGISYLPRLRR